MVDDVEPAGPDVLATAARDVMRAASPFIGSFDCHRSTLLGFAAGTASQDERDRRVALIQDLLTLAGACRRTRILLAGAERGYRASDPVLYSALSVALDRADFIYSTSAWRPNNPDPPALPECQRLFDALIGLGRALGDSGG